MTGLRTVGLFAGIGGLELGLASSGHTSELLVEWAEPAAHVLRTQFPDAKVLGDVRELDALPKGTDLVVAGFPCQDLSSVGQKAGIDGSKSSLIGEVFRLLQGADVPWLVLENVPFLLSLGKGRAMKVVTDELHRLGYSWAYRVVDSNSFGLPQRRNRWFLVASREGDPRNVLLADNVERPPVPSDIDELACGFYWTEGMRALGWAVDGVPPIKCGSSVGVASPPAIWLPSGAFVTPDIRDAERLQGFAADWTAPALEVARGGERWRLIGNAVSVPVATWIGSRLQNPGQYESALDPEVPAGAPWPRRASWSVSGIVHSADVGPWPQWDDRPHLRDFLHFDGKPLSVRAGSGFLRRTAKGSLRFPAGLLDALQLHIEDLGQVSVFPQAGGERRFQPAQRIAPERGEQLQLAI